MNGALIGVGLYGLPILFCITNTSRVLFCSDLLVGDRSTSTMSPCCTIHLSNYCFASVLVLFRAVFSLCALLAMLYMLGLVLHHPLSSLF